METTRRGAYIRHGTECKLHNPTTPRRIARGGMNLGSMREFRPLREGSQKSHAPKPAIPQVTQE